MEKYDVLMDSLRSLDFAAKKYSEAVSVLVLVNVKSTDDSKAKLEAKALYDKLRSVKFHFDFYCFYHEMDIPSAGVGYARKLLMDSAFRSCNSYGTDGLIINLDADTLVDCHYFTEIQAWFDRNQGMEAGSIAFSHRFDHNSTSSVKAIIDYESHLRYFINMQRLLNLPFAYQTIGSAMAVRSFAYAKMGGMPVRQAGEDFYFLHKYTKNFRLGDINGAIVYPSNRSSQRVPFGTGKAIEKALSEETIMSYNPKSFEILAAWLYHLLAWESSLKKTYDDKLMRQYQEVSNFAQEWERIKKHTASKKTLLKAFFNWFDAFRLMKYLHFMRDQGFHDISTQDCMAYVLTELQLPVDSSALINLEQLRQYDQKQRYRTSEELI